MYPTAEIKQKTKSLFLQMSILWYCTPVNEKLKMTGWIQVIQILVVPLISHIIGKDMFLELHKNFYGCSTTHWNCYQQHHLQVTGVTKQKCGLPYQDKNDHQIIITHYLLFFLINKVTFLSGRSWAFDITQWRQCAPLKTKIMTLVVPCSNSCHRWVTECSTPLATWVFPFCCQAKDLMFILTETQSRIKVRRE